MMKVGDKVRYITKSYDTVEGTITNIIGMGEKNHPKLDLQIGKQLITSVSHESDIDENAEGKKNICYSTVSKPKKKTEKKVEEESLKED